MKTRSVMAKPTVLTAKMNRTVRLIIAEKISSLVPTILV